MGKLKAKKKVKRERLPMTPMPEGATLKVTLLPNGEAEARMYGARASKAKACATCGHAYIQPCTTPKMLAACPNAQWLASQPKRKAKK